MPQHATTAKPLMNCRITVVLPDETRRQKERADVIIQRRSSERYRTAPEEGAVLSVLELRSGQRCGQAAALIDSLAVRISRAKARDRDTRTRFSAAPCHPACSGARRRRIGRDRTFTADVDVGRTDVGRGNGSNE